jgi:hypothetical protein
VLGLLGLLLVGLAGGVGAYTKLGWGPVAPGTPASNRPSTLTQPPPPSPVDTPIVPVSTETPTPSAEAAVLRAMQGHWDAITSGRFDEAYAYLGPNLAKGQASWVSSHERDGISDIHYTFSVRDVNGDTATVDILNLQTKAQSARTASNPEGCLRWSGNYVLVRQSERWLINQANVSSTPC